MSVLSLGISSRDQRPCVTWDERTLRLWVSLQTNQRMASLAGCKKTIRISSGFLDILEVNSFMFKLISKCKHENIHN